VKLHTFREVVVRKGIGNKWRVVRDRCFKYLLFILSFLGISPLVLIIGYIVVKGLSSMSLRFLFSLPVPVGEKGGGIANAIVGTGILVFVASFFSVPLGVLGGIYLNEYGGYSNRKRWLTYCTRLSVEMLQGIPSIVIGIVVWMWVVLGMGHFSALAGGIALGIMMLPTVVKSTEETLRLVPPSIREGALALGVPYYRVVLRVLIPASKSGILTGILLGIARIAGETAPLLFTAFGNPYFSTDITEPINSLPLLIFNYATSPYEEWHRIAWGASLVLIGFVFLLSLSARFFVSRGTIKKLSVNKSGNSKV